MTSTSSKTDQILSRYRPIAPKPPLEGPPTPENIQQPPFSKTHQYLLARPSRNRKRIKNGGLPSSAAKKLKSARPAFSPTRVASPAHNSQLAFSLHGFSHAHGHGHGHGFPSVSEKPMTLVTLPFLPYPSSSCVQEVSRSGGNTNMYSQFRQSSEIPREMDLLQNLHAMDSARKGNVISPRAVRPVGSSISVECIQEDLQWHPNKCVAKKPEEVEAEMEMDTLPAVVTDSSNRVRLANSAYMEMVGQPECKWLDSMANPCKRIGGKVILDLSDSGMPISDGFSCRVRIEWGSDAEKNSVSAHCDAVKLSCESKDYLFTWRFHTRETK